MEEIIPQQVGGLDFSDELPSGFRFTPMDSELIVDYLKAKMELRDLPKCRLHEVNIYNHSPDQLAEGYRSHDNVWYYLTPRDRKYPKGNRPDRAVGQFGFWKATQKHKDVYDDKTGEMVGHKTSLAFYITKDEKTKWLMHEYTTIEPNLPCFKFGGQNTNNNNKLNEWVLCKIYYKKKKKEEPDVIMTTTNPNIKKKVKKVTQAPKGTRVPKRRRVSAEENHCEENAPQLEDTNNPHLDLDTNYTHHLQHHQVQMEPTPMLQQGNNRINIDGDTHSSSPYDPIINNPMQPAALQSSIQPPQSQCYQLNHHFTYNAIASNLCQISTEPPTAANSSPQPQPLDDHYMYTTTPAATEHGLIPESNHIYDQNSMLPSTDDSAWQALLFSDDDDGIFPEEVVQSWCKNFVQGLQNQPNMNSPTYYGLDDQQPDASPSAYHNAAILSASAYHNAAILSPDPPVNVVEEEEEWSYDIVEQHCAD